MGRPVHSSEMIPLIALAGIGLAVGLALGLYLLLHTNIEKPIGRRPTDRQMLVGMEITVFLLLITAFVIDEIFGIAGRFQSKSEVHPLVTIRSALYLFGSFSVSVLLYGAARHWLKWIASLKAGPSRTDDRANTSH